MELLAGGRSIGYLLKSRVTDVADFIETLQRVTEGASVMDPALVQELVSAWQQERTLQLEIHMRQHRILYRQGARDHQDQPAAQDSRIQHRLPDWPMTNGNPFQQGSRNS